MKTHWFPLIRPYLPLIPWGGVALGGVARIPLVMYRFQPGHVGEVACYMLSHTPTQSGRRPHCESWENRIASYHPTERRDGFYQITNMKGFPS